MTDRGTPGAPATGGPGLRLLRLVAFVSTLDRFAMPPMLLTISRHLHVPVAAVVAAAGAYYLAYGLMQPVWGVVSDRIGTVRTIRITLLCAAVATSLAATAQSVVWLTVTRALAGAGFGAAIPGSLVYIGDTVPPGRRQRDVTGLMSGVALGTTVATGGAGLLASAVSWRWPFLITATLTVALLPALWRMSPRTRSAGGTVLGPLRLVLTDRAALLVLAVAFVEGAVILGTLTFLPPALESTGLSTSVAGAVTAVYGLTVLATAPLAGRLSTRLSGATLIGVGAVALSAACGLVWAALLPAFAVGGCLLLGVAWAFLHSTLQTWATEVVPAARAMAVSLFAGSLFAGSAVASALGGGPAGQGRYPAIFLAALVASVPLGLAAAVGRLRWRPARQP
ncbi:MAG TPA: MFS transporter [Mycobacteriales bacterium]|nr:MFS transporter [Mycobacteriales bacterium]